MKDLKYVQNQVKTAQDLAAFAKLLSVEIENDPEYRERFLSDAMEGLWAWMESSQDELPDQPDWNVVSHLLTAALFYD